MSMRYQAGILTASYFPLKTPSAPTIGAATAGNTQVSVAFTAPTDVGGGAITSYQVVVTDSSSGAVFTNTGASSPIVVTGLTNGNNYTARVAAINAFGAGPFSANSSSFSPTNAGQQAYTTAGTYSWVAPSGVTSVSAVCVGAGGGGWGGSTGTSGGQSYFINTSTVRAFGGSEGTSAGFGAGGSGGTGDGGGNGGNGSTKSGSAGGGGGGAGGYSGAGGNATTTTGNAGSGGGGGGGVAPTSFSNPYTDGGGGGGVGILGQGSNGAGGTNAAFTNTAGKGGSSGGDGGYTGQGGFGGTYGGGGGGFGGGSGGGGGGGGELRYKNNISVTPGNSYTVVVGSNSAVGYPGGPGAVRIIWPGTSRQFPSTNTGDL